MDWIATVVSGDAVRARPEIGAELPLTDLYEGVALPESIEDGPHSR